MLENDKLASDGINSITLTPIDSPTCTTIGSSTVIVGLSLAYKSSVSSIPLYFAVMLAGPNCFALNNMVSSIAAEFLSRLPFTLDNVKFILGNFDAS